MLRCSVEDDKGPVRSVVVKQVTATEFTTGGNGPSQRFLNELAGLQMLNAGSDRGPWPGLVASSAAEGLLILEDVGTAPTVLDLLVGNDADLAEDALMDMARSLGAAHAQAHEHVEKFQKLRGAMGVDSVLSDSNRDLRNDIALFRESFDHFGVRAHPAFFVGLEDLESNLRSADGFQTVIHADAGPQNFIHTGGGAVLIDFEFMAPGNALLDLVSARLGFPHSEEGRRIPVTLVEAVEEQYRAAVTATMPEVGDDDLFEATLVDACAHWALGRWARTWTRLFRDRRDLEPAIDIKRAQTLSIYEGFMSLADESGLRAVLAETLSACVTAVRREFPALERSPLYECFSRAGPTF